MLPGKPLHLKRLFSTLFLTLAAASLLTACQNRSQATVGSPPERLFLQQLDSDSVIVKWRGDARSACLLDSKGTVLRCRQGRITPGNHREVLFDHLDADRQYHYRIGDFADETTRFRTAPTTGELPDSGQISLWLLGDSGTASERNADGSLKYPGQARSVMEGFLKYRQQRDRQSPDIIALLGDNAYVAGTDRQWQEALFDLYGPLLHGAPIWPTIGNHEMGYGEIYHPSYGEITHGGISRSADPDSYWTPATEGTTTLPYLDIFSLPDRGQNGGVASGTEQYYAVDYGNLHLVSLDSQLSARDKSQREAMRQWLIADLSANDSDWTIVIFHHPPYTKGSHDSDTGPASRAGIDQPLIDMREEFTPIFEDYGVDLVYSGHSHSYERSYYLNGHRGDAETFNAERHAELNDKGQPATGRGDQFYRQVSDDSGVDDKVVYTVAGSAGLVSLRNGNLDHPAHAVQPEDPQKRRGLAMLGSVVVELDRHSLAARFVDTEGRVRDAFVLKR